MATEFVVMLAAGAHGAVESAVAALDQLEELEAEWSVFRDDSEVSRLNRAAADAPVRVSASTFALLERAIQWSEWTDGAFDVTAGPLVQAWGFGQRRGRKPTAEEIEAAQSRVGYQHLRLDRQRQSVAFAKPGMSINLGAIGKGEAIDLLAQRLVASGVENFLIHGGQSSVLARGDQAPGSGKGWAVGIAHPTKPSRRLTGVWLRDAALGTSGSGKQFFHHRGRRYGHVIDPRTGYPAGDLLALTVVTETACDADACATGFFVAGSERARAWTDEQAERRAGPTAAMILVWAGTRQDEVQWEVCGELAGVEPAEGEHRDS